MPTDDERREVAARLRSLRMTAPGVTSLGHGYLWSLLWAVSGKELRESNRCDWFERMCSRLADLIEPNRGSGGRTILCAHCENASWCGCEPGDEQGGCDFEPSVTEGEPPYNLYSLYEAVLKRHPRDECAIEDDEVDELVDALLDICNAPGHEHIQRPQPDEPKVKCVAEVKVDGERLEQLAHDAAVELTGIDRDAERTCHVESSHEVEGDWCCAYFEYELSCGHEMAWGDQLPPSYCPECGRRVLYDSNDYI